MSECLYVSFYTPDYADRAANLIQSLKAFDLDFEVSARPDTGRWVENCAMKPRFIFEMMERYPGRPIVWTDADSVLRTDPLMFESQLRNSLWPTYDAAVCEYQWRNGGKETLSGTLYFAPNAGAKHLVDMWCALQTVDVNIMDQRVLERAVRHARTDGVRVADLPVEYCFIYDFHRQEWPDKKPVFEHFQHSRKTKEVKA